MATIVWLVAAAAWLLVLADIVLWAARSPSRPLDTPQRRAD